SRGCTRTSRTASWPARSCWRRSNRRTPQPSRSTRRSKETTMKFSYVMLPDYPLEQSLRSIEVADELGFYAVYAADETWHKDLWLLFAAAADRTKNVR